MKWLLFLVAVSACYCSGCNPARRISMKNSSADTAEFILTASDDSIGFNPLVLHNSKELRFRIPPGKNNEINLSFGLGEWTKDYIDFFIKYLVAVQMTSAHQNVKLDSAQTIKDYFLAHRKKRGTVVALELQ